MIPVVSRISTQSCVIIYVLWIEEHENTPQGTLFILVPDTSVFITKNNKSFMYILKKRGPKMDPCGTPLSNSVRVLKEGVISSSLPSLYKIRMSKIQSLFRKSIGMKFRNK